MENHQFFVEKIRFHLLDANTIVFVGWFFDGKVKNRSILARLDGKDCKTELTIHKGADVRQKYLGNFNEINEEVIGMVRLPEGWEAAKSFSLVVTEDGQSVQAYKTSVGHLLKNRMQVEFYIEGERMAENCLLVNGWAIGEKAVKFSLFDKNGKLIPITVNYYFRKDLKATFPEQDTMIKPGFQVKADLSDRPEISRLTLVMEDGKKKSERVLRNFRRESKFWYLYSKGQCAYRYFVRNGLHATIRKIDTKLRKTGDTSYEEWRKKYEPTLEELACQKQEVLKKNPYFSIVVPLYRTNLAFLKELIQSIQEQTYEKWELCLADGSADGENGKTSLTDILEKYAAADKRIRYVTLDENLGISENTNAALELAKGDYVVLVDHDDIVSPNALYEFAKVIEKYDCVDVIYSDEDKISMDGKTYFEPHFKSDFNIDLLRSMNYICHLFSVKRSLQREIGGFRKEYDGAQDYDFILRCCEKAENIYHVPKILYHWRCHMESTAANPESKLYAFEAGKEAINAHYKRVGVPAHAEHAEGYGMYRTFYEWEEEPLVSVLIPNKDHIEDLEKCVNSIMQKSDYKNLEFIIVENNSTEDETFDFYEELQKKYANVKVLYYKGEFNYSKINNFGAEEASGELLLLLNNDTEIINSDCIREMVNYCIREDVGVVGARLFYGDDTIQHAGVVIGFGGMVGHTFIGKSRYENGYFGRLVCAQDYSAVTAACMMTKKKIYEAVGGLTEEYQVAFNDIDYCLKVRKMGKLVVYNPYAQLYHYESKSRGLEDTPEKVERFAGEVERLVSTWPKYFEEGDPYYNKNLTLDRSDFALRR